MMIGRQAWMAVIVAASVAGVAVVGPAEASQETPFTGVVVEDVEVRAGGGTAFYVVGEVERGGIVEVEEIIFRWHKIRPPEGVHSFISKAFVDVRGDGTRGVVNRDRVEVSAASVRGPAESYRWQADLNEGDEVRIVEEVNSFYRIEPPEGAFVFLPPDSVRPAEEAELLQRPAGEEVAEAAGEGEAAAEGEADEADEASARRDDVDAEAEVEASEGLAENGEAEAAEAEAEVEAEGQAVAEAERDAEAAEADAGEEAEAFDSPAVTAELREVERAMLPLLHKPIGEQPIDEMIAAYEAVAEQVELPGSDQRVVAHRLAALERNARLAQTLARVREVREQADRSAAADRELDDSPRAFEDRGYSTVARLAASRVFDGERLPRLYRLLDPETGRTIAYLEPDERIDAERMVDQLVGLEGERRYDRAIRLHVFDVETIELLERRAAEGR